MNESILNCTSLVPEYVGGIPTDVFSLCSYFPPIIMWLRDESQLKASFMQNMIEDRTESALSYYEFLLHLQQQISK